MDVVQDQLQRNRIDTYSGYARFVAPHEVEVRTADGSRTVQALYLPTYIVPALIPFFVSTLSWAKIMGGVLAVTLVATFIIERTTLTSVWCFSAAILSGVIVMGIAAERRLTVALTTPEDARAMGDRA